MVKELSHGPQYSVGELRVLSRGCLIIHYISLINLYFESYYSSYLSSKTISASKAASSKVLLAFFQKMARTRYQSCILIIKKIWYVQCQLCPVKPYPDTSVYPFHKISETAYACFERFPKTYSKCVLTLGVLSSICKSQICHTIDYSSHL